MSKRKNSKGGGKKAEKTPPSAPAPVKAPTDNRIEPQVEPTVTDGPTKKAPKAEKSGEKYLVNNHVVLGGRKCRPGDEVNEAQIGGADKAARLVASGVLMSPARQGAWLQAQKMRAERRASRGGR